MGDRLRTYLFWIDFVGADEDRLNAIVEEAANDDEITNDQYCAIYAHALEKMQQVLQ